MPEAKDFLLKETIKTTAEEETETEKKKAAHKRTALYKTLFVSGPDFAIQRTTKQTCVDFVYFRSADQYYLKNEKTGEIKTGIDAKDIAGFFKDLEEPFTFADAEEKPVWLDIIPKGTVMAEFLVRLMEPDAKEFLTKGYVCFKERHLPTNKNTLLQFPRLSLDDLSLIFDEIKDDRETLRENVADAVTCINCEDSIIQLAANESYPYFYPYHAQYYADRAEVSTTLGLIKKTYGLDGARYFVESLYESPQRENTPRMFQIENILEKAAFDIKRFCEYAFYESYKAGFGGDGSIDPFYSNWADDLSLQEYIYGKIREKYPENLLSHHNILAAKSRTIKRQIDKDNWEKAATKMARYEVELDGEYAIIAPKTPSDMVDEARAQSNCLSSYISSVTNGNTMIFFLRRKKDKAKSFVTIEIRKNGELGQVKARFNREPSCGALAAVKKWHTDMFGEFGEKYAALA